MDKNHFSVDPEYVIVRVEELRHGVQYRTNKNSKPEEEFVASIKATHGPLCLIKTRNAWESEGEDPDLFYIIDGHRRTQACVLAGIGQVTVEHYGDISPEESNAITTITNVARKKMTKGEKRAAILDLEELGFSISYIAELLGMSRQTVTDILTVKKRGTKKLQAAEEKGEVSSAVAGKIAQMPKRHQNTALDQVKGKSTSEGKKTVAELRKKMNIPDCLRAPKVPVPDPNWQDKADRPVRYEKKYPVHPQIKLLLQDFEWLTQKHLMDVPRNDVWQAYMNAIRLMKGEIDMGQLFPGYGHIQPGGRKEHK